MQTEESYLIIRNYQNVWLYGDDGDGESIKIPEMSHICDVFWVN